MVHPPPRNQPAHRQVRGKSECLEKPMVGPIQSTQCFYLGIWGGDRRTPQGHSPCPGTALLRSRARASAAGSRILTTRPEPAPRGRFIADPTGISQAGKPGGQELTRTSTSPPCFPHRTWPTPPPGTRKQKPSQVPPKPNEKTGGTLGPRLAQARSRSNRSRGDFLLAPGVWRRNAGDPCSAPHPKGLCALSIPKTPSTAQEGTQVTGTKSHGLYWSCGCALGDTRLLAGGTGTTGRMVGGRGRGSSVHNCLGVQNTKSKGAQGITQQHAALRARARGQRGGGAQLWAWHIWLSHRQQLPQRGAALFLLPKAEGGETCEVWSPGDAPRPPRFAAGGTELTGSGGPAGVFSPKGCQDPRRPSQGFLA